MAVSVGVLAAAALAAVGLRSAGGSTAFDKGGAAQDRVVVPEVPPSIQLQGVTDRMGSATTGRLTLRNGSVEIDAGSITLPQFTVTLARQRAGDMVSLAIDAPGVKFTSILGTYGRLAALAGPDRILTVEESDALRVSPLSTAMEFATRRNLGGMPATDAQHEAEWRAIVDAGLYHGAGLGSLAAILELTANGSLPLPQGYPSGYALMEDREAVATFAWEHDSEIGSREALERLATTLVSAVNVRAPLALLGARVDATSPIIEQFAEVLEREDTQWLVHDAQAREPLHEGGLDVDGTIALNPVVPPVTESSLVCPGGVPGTRRDTLLSRQFRLHRSGLATGVWMGVYEYEATFDPCFQQPPIRYRSIFLAASVPLHASSGSRVPLKTGAVAGSRALPYLCRAAIATPSGSRQTLQVCEYTPHRFDPGGTGVVLEIGTDIDTSGEPQEATGTAPLQWSAGPDADLSVQYDGIRTRYWRVDTDDAAAAGVVHVSDAVVDGRSLSIAGYVPMLNGNSPAGDLAFSPVGTWAFASFEQDADPYLLPQAATRTRMVFKADGKLDEHSWDVATGPGSSLPGLRTWRYVGPRLYMTTVRLVSGTDRYYDCAEAAAAGRTDCYPGRVRVFRPMRQVGNRVYGVQDLYFNTTPRSSPPYQFSRTSRATYYERRSFSTDPPVTAAPKVRAY